jgi:hypothetical protein
MFLEGQKTPEIAQWVNSTLGLSPDDPNRVTREQIYQFLIDARRRRFITLRPPLSVLNQRIADRYQVDPTVIDVVYAAGKSALEHVASQAAAVTLRLIQNLGRRRVQTGRRGEVHLGLGAGWTTRTLAYHLANQMREERDLPAIVLHALSCGFRVEEPRTSPISFFGFFDDVPHEVRYVGLFASPVVESSRYKTVKRDPGVADALARKGEIDIVVTALATEGHECFELNQMLSRTPGDAEFLRSQGWVGDVQYRPFSPTGPIQREAKRRAVTLFELRELVDLARQNEKYVVVACGPCPCGHTRDRALRPLLTAPALKLWTHLVMDLDTASELVVA